MNTDLPVVELYLAGSAHPASGTARWAALLRCQTAEKELAGSLPGNTTPGLVLAALAAGLGALNRPCRVQLFTTCRYVTDGLAALRRWQAQGWTTNHGQPLMHQDLWQQVAELAARHAIHIEPVCCRGCSPHLQRVYRLVG
jgi:ribonuclease HI